MIIGFIKHTHSSLLVAGSLIKTRQKQTLVEFFRFKQSFGLFRFKISLTRKDTKKDVCVDRFFFRVRLRYL